MYSNRYNPTGYSYSLSHKGCKQAPCTVFCTASGACAQPCRGIVAFFQDCSFPVFQWNCCWQLGRVQSGVAGCLSSPFFQAHLITQMRPFCKSFIWSVLRRAEAFFYLSGFYRRLDSFTGTYPLASRVVVWPVFRGADNDSTTKCSLGDAIFTLCLCCSARSTPATSPQPKTGAKSAGSVPCRGQEFWCSLTLIHSVLLIFETA